MKSSDVQRTGKNKYDLTERCLIMKTKRFYFSQGTVLALCRSECQGWQNRNVDYGCESWITLCDEIFASHLWGFLFNDTSIKIENNRRVTIVCPDIFLHQFFLPATGTSLWRHQTEAMECRVTELQERTCATELYNFVL